MSTPTLINHATQTHWSELYSLLSLAGVADLYALLGLDFVEAGAFLSILRTCIEAARIEFKLSPHEGVQSLNSQEPHEFILSCLRRKLDAAVFQRYLSWERTAFLGTHANQPQVSAWEIVLLRITPRERWPINVDAEEMNWLTKLYTGQSQTIQDEWNRKIDKVKERRLSEWDIDIYLRRSWNHFSEFRDPYLPAKLMALNRAALTILQRATTELPAGTVEQLRLAGQVILDTLGVEMPESLASLDVLLRLG